MVVTRLVVVDVAVPVVAPAQVLPKKEALPKKGIQAAVESPS